LSEQKKPRRIDPEDLIGLAGLALFAAGAWMAWRPAALIFVGLMLFVYAWVKSRSQTPPGTGTA
jgi:uncharacterized membrane protein